MKVVVWVELVVVVMVMVVVVDLRNDECYI